MANQPPAATEEVAPEEEPSGPLKYKTWSLKVSVHCEGCKRKVKKILLGIEGVYTVDVDTKAHKATVTASVDPEVLIRKLEKSGKHAEIWPEKGDQKESKRSKKKKNKQSDQDNPESNDNDDSAAAEPEKADPNKGEATGPPPSKVVEVVSSGKPGGSVQFKEVRVDPNNQPAGDNNPQPPEGGANNAGGGGGGGGGGGKKKKRKGKGGGGGGGGATGNGNGGEPPSNGNGEGNDGPPPAPQGQGPPPPRNYPVYDHPPAYYAPPPQAGMPVYAVSYNTAYPSSSYTASYYANPPHAYAYVHQGGSDSAEGGPSDTFEMFSDENPNACAVM